MILPRPIRQIARLLRGRVSPELGGLGIGLGWWFGLIPGLQGIHALILTAALVLKVPLGPLVTMAGLGRVAALAIAPALYHSGRFMNAYAPWLGTAIRQVPVLALTDLDRPAVVGAVVLGLASGAILGIAAAMVMRGFRRSWLALEGRSQRLQHWQQLWYVRLVEMLLIGSRPKDPKAAWSARPKYIRRSGIAVLAVLIVGLLLGHLALGSRVLRSKAQAILTRINGATVDIQDLEVSLLGARVKVEGLAVADADQPTQNGLEVARASADLDLYQLLLGKVIVEQLTLSGVGMDRPRSSPAQVVADKSGEDRDQQGWSIPAIGSDWSKLATLDRYMTNAGKLKSYLKRLRPYLSLPARGPKPPVRYSQYLSARGQTPRVRFLVKHVQVDQIQTPVAFLDKAKATLTNLSDAPALTGLPIHLALSSEQGLRFDMDLQWQADGGVAVEGQIQGLDLAALQSALRQDNPLVFEAGKVAGTFTGQLTSQAVDIQASLVLTCLRAAVGKGGLPGLEVNMGSEQSIGLDRFELPLWIRGPLSDPRIGLDTRALVDALKEGLIQAGKQKVIERVQERINKELPPEVSGILGPVLQQGGLGGMFGGRRDPNRP